MPSRRKPQDPESNHGTRGDGAPLSGTGTPCEVNHGLGRAEVRAGSTARAAGDGFPGRRTACPGFRRRRREAGETPKISGQSAAEHAYDGAVITVRYSSVWKPTDWYTGSPILDV